MQLIIEAAEMFEEKLSVWKCLETIKWNNFHKNRFWWIDKSPFLQVKGITANSSDIFKHQWSATSGDPKRKFDESEDEEYKNSASSYALE